MLANNNKHIRLESATIPQDDAIAILNLKSTLPFKTKSLSISYRDIKADQASLIIQDVAGYDLPSLGNFPFKFTSNNNNFSRVRLNISTEQSKSKHNEDYSPTK